MILLDYSSNWDRYCPGIFAAPLIGLLKMLVCWTFLMMLLAFALCWLLCLPPMPTARGILKSLLVVITFDTGGPSPPILAEEAPPTPVLCYY